MDRSPQSRSEEMFEISFEIWDHCLPWSRDLKPVLCLERDTLDTLSKTLAWLFQNWLLVDPSAEEMIPEFVAS